MGRLTSTTLTICFSLAGCGGGARAPIVPAHLQSANSAVSKSDTQHRSPHVIKLAEGGRQWEISLPPVSGGYELKIPVGDGTPLLPTETQLVAQPDDTPHQKAEAAAGYLRSIAQINALYERESYELALSEVSKLLGHHPDDAKLLAMAGTLHFKLGEPEKAAQSWEKVLELEPDNTTVAEALESLP